MNEKSIIRTDRERKDTFTRYDVTVDSKQKCGNRVCNVAQSVICGMNEKSIIKEQRDHYATIHPTQKTVRLIERLLNLVCGENALVLDPFIGSGTTAIACINTNRNYIGFELDEEYYKAACERIKRHTEQKYC